MRCLTTSRCAVVYTEGLNVAVWRDDAGRLASLVEVPQRFFNRTLGLLGHWSSNRTDDFLLSNGRLLPSVNNITPSEQSLIPFGQSCGCQSLFYEYANILVYILYINKCCIYYSHFQSHFLLYTVHLFLLLCCQGLYLLQRAFCCHCLLRLHSIPSQQKSCCPQRVQTRWPDTVRPVRAAFSVCMTSWPRATQSSARRSWKASSSFGTGRRFTVRPSL